jgi:hypothetical protein
VLADYGLAVVRGGSGPEFHRGPAPGAAVAQVGADLVLLQEVNPGSAEVLRRAAGADWLVCAVNHRVPEPVDGQSGAAGSRSPVLARLRGAYGCPRAYRFLSAFC